MPETQHRFKFSFDVAMLVNALRRDFLWRGYVVAAVVLIAGTLPSIQAAQVHWVTIASCVGAVGLIGMSRWQLWRRARLGYEFWLTQAPGGALTWELDEQGFSVVMEKTSTRFEWSDLRRLWRYHDIWLLEVVKMQSLCFPPDLVSEESKTFITACCERAGVVVNP